MENSPIYSKLQNRNATKNWMAQKWRLDMENALLYNIGKRLSASRKKAGLTQEQLGEMAGLSIKMISAAENGHKAMRPENIVKICECLSISTDYLLKGTDAMIGSLAEQDRLAALSIKQKLALERIVDDFLTAFE